MKSPTMLIHLCVQVILGKACGVHWCELQQGKAPIYYGFHLISPERRAAAKRLFPNAQSCIRLGCVVRGGKEQEVWFCPMCRQAESDWQREHEVDY